MEAFIASIKSFHDFHGSFHCFNGSFHGSNGRFHRRSVKASMEAILKRTIIFMSPNTFHCGLNVRYYYNNCHKLVYILLILKLGNRCAIRILQRRLSPRYSSHSQLAFLEKCYKVRVYLYLQRCNEICRNWLTSNSIWPHVYQFACTPLSAL